ncbi:proline/glycine betaine ABC transporter permease [Alicyclobacillus cycloheptanicus]|uniref:Glycine betaine/proline transport system permease protein n=1 Tax=Alicyclobacillus cycloheptanicus TaxID=1457 RepID=A0ABT9XM00_9BACL|nr:proline/glycine betaine ABC transporter permease [Alicyclobacillus cycloheptanicus]MDQ0191150.1 glycine betaine/proline transport system permease protein [Alicyclobacillus cycloheptanicus]WDM01891.1 proline/glycine betaine ABC transporter permease [Alicyclobacillus cycloheptanicus]
MLPKIPLANWINDFVNWITKVLGPVLMDISKFVEHVMNAITAGVLWVPWWLVILLIAAIGYLSGKWKLAVGTAIGLVFVYDLQLWNDLINTLVMVVVSAAISLVIGIPIGIAAARRAGLYRVISPILDLMQTMPPFVYLVPVLLLFSVGTVPAILATIVFAMPPSIRLTRLGILQVPEDLVEAAEAFGATDRQLLWKVQIPLAMPSIKAGVNQTLMLALSMVVIASMVGAGGLGADVMQALETLNVGTGVEAGLAIVILAVVLDRISQGFGKDYLNK